MDGMGDMDGGGSGTFMPLSTDGVDFSNDTQAFDFLQSILDDSYFQVESNAYARAFWYGIVVTIALAALVGLVQRTLLRSSTNKVSNLLTAPANALIAVGRECSTLHFTPQVTTAWFQIPPMGSLILVVTYFAFIAALEFINNDYPGAQHYQAYGLRAAWLAVAQVPLIILLAGKNNLVGLLTGVNYQRLNILHRWVARGLLVLATMHFGFQSTGWNKYGLMQLEWKTDSCPPTGIAAYAILLWMNIANLRPFRHLSYSLFVIQHILMFFGFIIALMIHLPETALYSRVYIWTGLGFYLLDRTVRTAWCLWNNKSICDARLECLDDVATKISIKSRAVKRWSPGSHILLAIPRFGFLQTHPATILSTPTSHGGDLVFILKAHKSFTKRLLRSAAATSLPKTSKSSPEKAVEPGPIPHSATHKCIIDGPYSSSHLDFGAFEIVALIAGGTGITFTLANLLDLADRAANNKPFPRAIDFTWIVRRKSHLHWVRDELEQAVQRLRSHGCKATCTVYITRDQNPDVSVLESEKRNTGSGRLDLKTSSELRSREIGSKSPTANGDTNSSSSSSQKDGGEIQIRYGRPDVRSLLLQSIVKSTEGETAVGTCGPLSLTAAVRNQYTRICDDRAVCKGSGLSGIYLHVENQYN